MEIMGLVEKLHNTFRGKKVFVTGHTGFKGSWLLVLLNRLGASVKGFALEPESTSLYNQINGNSLCDSTIGDIRDRSLLEKEIHSFKPDFIFHLAAQALVRSSYDCPIDTYQTNAMGTAHVLEAIRSSQGPMVAVMITTDKVYQNTELGVPFKESDPLGGHDTYSASKAAAEIIISSYRNSFFSNSLIDDHQKSISSARAGNVIGGGDWSKDRLVPDVIRSLSNHKEVIIRNPKSVRPWQHVIEPLVGYLSLAMNQSLYPNKYNEAWNFGPELMYHQPVEEVVQVIIHLWGFGKMKVVPSLERHESNFLKLDISKTLENLEWSPRLSLHQAIEWTTEWYYLTDSNQKDSREILEKQIDRYFKLLM